MNRYRAAHANGNTIALGFFPLKGKHLAKAAHIQPGFAGSLCISIFIFFSLFHCCAEQIERRALIQLGKENEKRLTNAERLRTAFALHPAATTLLLDKILPNK